MTPLKIKWQLISARGGTGAARLGETADLGSCPADRRRAFRPNQTAAAIYDVRFKRAVAVRLRASLGSTRPCKSCMSSVETRMTAAMVKMEQIYMGR